MTNAMYTPGASVASSRRLFRRLLGDDLETSQIGFHRLSDVLSEASEDDTEALRLIIDRTRRAPGKATMPRSVAARGMDMIEFSAMFADSIMSTPETSILAVHPSGRIIGIAHCEFASGDVLSYNHDLFDLPVDVPIMEFGRLFVLNDYRDFGIASRLMSQNIATVKELPLPNDPPMFLIVEVENEDGVEFFERAADFGLMSRVIDKGTEEDHIVEFDGTRHYEYVVDMQVDWNGLSKTSRRSSGITISSEYEPLIHVQEADGFTALKTPDEIESTDFITDVAGYPVSASDFRFEKIESASNMVSVNENELLLGVSDLVAVHEHDNEIQWREANALHLSELWTLNSASALIGENAFPDSATDPDITISKTDTYRNAVALRFALEEDDRELTRNISPVDDSDGSHVSFRVVHGRSRGPSKYPVRYPVRRIRTTDEYQTYSVTLADESSQTVGTLTVNGYIVRVN